MIKAIVAARDLGSNLAQNKKPIIFLVISGVTNSPGAVSSFFSISMAPVVIVILTAGARTGELKLFSMSIFIQNTIDEFGAIIRVQPLPIERGPLPYLL